MPAVKFILEEKTLCSIGYSVPVCCVKIYRTGFLTPVTRRDAMLRKPDIGCALKLRKNTH